MVIGLEAVAGRAPLLGGPSPVALDSTVEIARVASRVREGGHHIPEDVIRRRFDKGLANFY